MNITSITWAHNEEDILSTFVRHNASLVDRMIIVLRRTSDRSAQILRYLAREGYDLDIRESSEHGHIQSSILTALMHENARRDRPDWILPLDADEFIAGTIEQSLALLSSQNVGLLPWYTYVPTPNDPLGQPNILKRITYRRAIESPQFFKICIPRSLAHNPETVIPLGSHFLCNKKTGEHFPSQEIPHVFLAHIPVRSERQLRQKVVSGWESHCANPDRKPGQAFQWEMLYERCLAPTPMTPEELQDIAVNYAMPKEMQKTPNEIVYDPVSDVCSRPVLHSRSSSLAPPGI